MTKIYNQAPQTSLRRKLRNQSPSAERHLWQRLRNRQIHGVKFRRQYGIGRYVVDFYCPALKLAIEVDGDSHFISDAPDKDRQRQAEIETLGVCFVRVTNADVYRRLDAVVDEVTAVVGELLICCGGDG